MLFKKFALLLTAGLASAGVIERRAQEIAHDAVRSIPETLPNDATGRSMKRFQPYINTEGAGCWPYPAVDTDGNWSGGLNPSGSQGGGCTNSVGQAYVRGAWYNGYYALMYAWYFPKDQSAIGGGHRHDWEAAVIWINNPAVANPTILGGSISGHGNFDNSRSVPTSSFYNGHPLCRYYVDVAVFGTHRIGWTSNVGGIHSLVNWESLSAAARSSLESVNWGSANFPLAGNFQSNLQKAYPF
ncbi:necrosis and ethylene inducing protein [Plectosphaerella cucumerina]|uniref:Necrosis and ethylene inducing protein n=1 Tax=Plectosphaerella cucumerina TaxID=40658 RepID=A0A8K0X612_9PEZI|nr:necrosis and ethylene inducing protein [Plectosphaerella cucumerina]